MENFDKNNTMVLKLGPDEIKQILHSQIGFYKDKEKCDPNCCMLGIAIVTILDQTLAFTHNDKTGETYFEGLKLYLDGDGNCVACDSNAFSPSERNEYIKIGKLEIIKKFR